jgi:hypothetical protein
MTLKAQSGTKSSKCHPKTLLSLIVDFEDSERRKSKQGDILPFIDKQIEQLRRKLKTYPARERNLYDLLSHEAVTKEYVLETINKLKQERLNDERHLTDLLETRKESKEDRLTFELDELSEILISNVLESTNASSGPTDGLHEKRRLLELLRLEIVADPHNYQFSFKLGGQLISTADDDYDDNPTLDQALNEFIQQHPDDYTDTEITVTLPKNKPLSLLVNHLKNLVTSEQTS